MTHSSSNSLSPLTRVELEMLRTVLDDQAVYPWNPQDPAADATVSALEQTWDDGGADYAGHWQAISSQAASLWNSGPAAAPSLTAALVQQFGTRMPTGLLSQLADRAQAVAQGSQSLMDQLVDCVQDVLSDWAIEDLQVMARPLALAMRDGHGEMVDVALRSVRNLEWEQLSEVEQARLSLAIARYAIAQAQRNA